MKKYARTGLKGERIGRAYFIVDNVNYRLAARYSLEHTAWSIQPGAYSLDHTAWILFSSTWVPCDDTLNGNVRLGPPGPSAGECRCFSFDFTTCPKSRRVSPGVAGTRVSQEIHELCRCHVMYYSSAAHMPYNATSAARLQEAIFGPTSARVGVAEGSALPRCECTIFSLPTATLSDVSPHSCHDWRCSGQEA
jgi:hypothetical protein